MLFSILVLTRPTPIYTLFPYTTLFRSLLQIEPHRELVAIDQPEKIGHGRNSARVPHGAGIVPRFRVFDLDDVRPHVGEMQRRHRTGKEPRQVEDADAGERLATFGFDHGLSLKKNGSDRLSRSAVSIVLLRVLDHFAV